MACELEDCWFVHNPAGPDNPVEPDSGKIEFMYVRVKDITEPYSHDPTGDGGNIYPGAIRNTSPWVQIETNVWTCYAELRYSSTPYWFWLRDKKVSLFLTIAEDVYGRRYGTNDPWTKLICVQDHVLDPSAGKCVKLLWGKQGSYNPCN